MTLTEFLLARIDEDEAAAKIEGFRVLDRDGFLPRSVSPARVLAVCEAHRRIVYAAKRTQESLERRSPRLPATDAINGHVIAYRDAVRILAAVYADHPDYDEAWRP